jgi:hypothetical protein
MPDSITISHAQEVVSHISQLGENKYSSIVAAANDTEKEKLKKTAIGTRMADLKPDEVTLVGADDNQITKQELVDTFNRELTKNGGAALTQKQIDYLWNTSIVAIKDPGESAATNSPATATVPSSSSTITNPSSSKTNPSTRPESVTPILPADKPTEDTEAPTLSSSSPSNGATDIAKNSNIDLTFSENITLADPAKVKLFKKSDNSEVEGITTSVVNGNTLRIKPQADLEDSTEYYVMIDPDAVTDTSKKKNAYAGITANTDLSFTTGTTVLTTEEQAAADKAAAEKNKRVSTTGVTQPSSNNFNKPVTKLNLDDNPNVQSDGEKKLGELVNLRYGLDLLESKDDVHVALGGDEEIYVEAVIDNLKTTPAINDQMSSGFAPDDYEKGKTPTIMGGFILRQAIEEYKKINKTEAETAEAARDKKINEMTDDDKSALTKVFENYQKKFTKLKDGITEDKLKKYLTDNYDTLKGLGIEGYPNAGKDADTAAINGKNKEELISLSVAARNKLNEKISEEFKTITISAEDKKAFLKKYTDIDFSDSEKSIEFIKGLTDKELLLFNKWKFFDNIFYSRDFIIRELSQHKLSLQNTLRLYPSSFSDDTDLISFTDRENLLKKYYPANTDFKQKKEFIQELTPAELVLLNPSSGFVSKQSLLRELEKPENKEKSLNDIFSAGVLSNYLSALKLKPLNEINKIVNNPEIKAALKRNIAPLAIPKEFEYSKDSVNGQLYDLDGNGDRYGNYLVDFGDGKAKFYKAQDEVLGLPENIQSGNYFLKLAQENKSKPGQAKNPFDLGYDTSGYDIYPTSLLRVGENARRIREKGTYGNVLNNILEKIYDSESKAPTDQKQWHKQMKQHVARMLLAKDPAEFDARRAEFQNYLNNTYKGISGGWFNIDGLRRMSNHADDQTEQMLRDVKELLNDGLIGS